MKKRKGGHFYETPRISAYLAPSITPRSAPQIASNEDCKQNAGLHLQGQQYTQRNTIKSLYM